MNSTKFAPLPPPSEFLRKFIHFVGQRRPLEAVEHVARVIFPAGLSSDQFQSQRQLKLHICSIAWGSAGSLAICVSFTLSTVAPTDPAVRKSKQLERGKSFTGVAATTMRPCLPWSRFKIPTINHDLSHNQKAMPALVQVQNQSQSEPQSCGHTFPGPGAEVGGREVGGNPEKSKNCQC